MIYNHLILRLAVAFIVVDDDDCMQALVRGLYSKSNKTEKLKVANNVE